MSKLSKWWSESDDADQTNYWSRKNKVKRKIGDWWESSLNVLAPFILFGIPALAGGVITLAIIHDGPPTTDQRFTAVCEYMGGSVYENLPEKACIARGGSAIIIEEDKTN